VPDLDIQYLGKRKLAHLLTFVKYIVFWDFMACSRVNCTFLPLLIVVVSIARTSDLVQVFLNLL